MNFDKQDPITVAIDAQISALASGGTESALLSLLLALGASETIRDRFVLLGLKGYDHELTPFMGDNMEKMTWPACYRWYDPNQKNTIGIKPSWQRLQSRLGPLGWLVPILYRYYAFNTPLSPKALRLAKRLGPAFMVAPAYRLYRGIRDVAARPMVATRADALLQSRKVSVVHFPYPLHFETNLPYVYEPWGLPHHHQPECFRPGEAEWMDELFGRGCRNAAMVITATRWVKQDIIDKYQIPSDRIAVIPRLPRFDHGERVMAREKALAGLPDTFALFPSATWVTKNHIRLIRAMAQLRNDHGIAMNLVCTGRTNTPESQNIQREIDRHKLHKQVYFLGVVSVERLNALYKSAKFLVHPSIFEGLGLPLLEAFHNGLPVLASAAACIPEVVGDAALQFDPFDEADIARALLEAMRNPGLLEKLRRKGMHRLTHSFPNSDKIATMFDTVYRHAAKVSLNSEQKTCLDEMLG